jgi:hypothetical protein
MKKSRSGGLRQVFETTAGAARSHLAREFRSITRNSKTPSGNASKESW